MRKTYFRLIKHVHNWVYALQENKRLKKEIHLLAHYRNQLLEITLSNSRIIEVRHSNEPLFIGVKESDNTIVFNLYNYEPSRLVTAVLTVKENEWMLLNIETVKIDAAEFKMILLAHVLNEAKRNSKKFQGQLQ